MYLHSRNKHRREANLITHFINSHFQKENALSVFIVPALTGWRTHAQRKQKKEAGIPASCLCVHILEVCTILSGLHILTQTPVPYKTKQKILGCTPQKERKGNNDPVKMQQLNSPVTMSPAGAGSGKGEGPRETAGRSYLPTQARSRTRERRKPWRWGSKEMH